MRVNLVLLFSLMTVALNAQELTFRGFQFGTDINTIISKEGPPTARVDASSGAKLIGDEYIKYDTIDVAGYAATMQIEFRAKRMIAGSYQFKLEQRVLSDLVYDPRNASQIYNDLLIKLSGLYGKPTKANNIELLEGTISALYAQNISNSAPYSASWDYLGGLVMLMLDYQNRWNLSLLYISPEEYQRLKANKQNTSGL